MFNWCDLMPGARSKQSPARKPNSVFIPCQLEYSETGDWRQYKTREKLMLAKCLTEIKDLHAGVVCCACVHLVGIISLLLDIKYFLSKR